MFRRHAGAAMPTAHCGQSAVVHRAGAGRHAMAGSPVSAGYRVEMPQSIPRHAVTASGDLVRTEEPVARTRRHAAFATASEIFTVARW